MKTNKNGILIVSVVVVGCLIFYFYDTKKMDLQSSTEKNLQKQEIKEKRSATKLENIPQKSVRKVAQVQQKEVGQGSLGVMAQLLVMSIEENSLEDLLKNLKTKNQKPIVSRQANPDTGEMLMVRTRAPMDGTRYFHAQYFSAETPNEYFVQHISFDFKPGANSMKQAIAAVSNSFGKLGKPHRQTNDFISWHLANNYVLWIKRMGAEDLQGNPFNAYGSRDVGTIKVAVEKNIHEG